MNRAKKRTSIYLQTTEVSAARTSGEIQQILIRAGASQIATDYGPDGRATGMRFTVANGKLNEAYSLPIRTEPLYERLQKQRQRYRIRNADKDRVQAEQIAWRQLLTWLKAQLAMIDIGMTTTGEVFFPYLLAAVDGRGKATTMYQIFEQHGRKLLPAGEPER
jgi:hypothetical protein